MSADSSANDSRTKRLDTERLDALLQKILPFARAAEAFARRSIGKVRTLAILGVLAALWIAYASAVTFEWELSTLLIVFALSAIPAALLAKIHGMLRAAIGLPQRVVDCANGLAGKAVEYRRLYDSRGTASPVATRPKFRELWRTGKSLVEIKALGDEAREIVSLAGGALVLANPAFAIVLACATGLTVVLVGIAAIVAVAFVL